MCIHFHFSFTLLHVYAFAIHSMVIAGVPSSQALLGFLITDLHLCAFLLYLARYLCGFQPNTYIYIYIHIKTEQSMNKQREEPLLSESHEITASGLLDSRDCITRRRGLEQDGRVDLTGVYFTCPAHAHNNVRTS